MVAAEPLEREALVLALPSVLAITRCAGAGNTTSQCGVRRQLGEEGWQWGKNSENDLGFSQADKQDKWAGSTTVTSVDAAEASNAIKMEMNMTVFMIDF